MKTKTFELIEVKADGEAGEVVALASVFNNVDLVGDRIKPGAFTKTLKAWSEKGDPIPIVSSHSWDDPMSHIGIADAKNVTQTKDGLLVQGQLDMDNPLAAQVHRLMKRRSLTGWSFGYTVPEGGEFMDDKGVNNITEIDLVEVGPTLKGANPEAQLQNVKSALEVEQVSEVEGKDEEPVTANSPTGDEEPKRANSAPDPLKKQSMDQALTFVSDGLPSYEPEVEEPEPERPSVAEIRRRSYEAILKIADV